MRRVSSISILIIMLVLFCFTQTSSAQTGNTVSALFCSDKDHLLLPELTQKVPAGNTIIIPPVPKTNATKGLGWTTNAKDRTVQYKPGSSVKIQHNTIFYPVYDIPEYSIRFFTNDGKVTYNNMTQSIEAGKTLTMPSVIPKNMQTFLGWADSPGKSETPLYVPGQTIRPDKNLDLYAVMFDVNDLEDFSYQTLSMLDTQKYSRIIFVGDSRTVQIMLALENEFLSNKVYGPHTEFIAQGGSGLHWLKDDGYSMLINSLKKSPGSPERPVAIVFNHGVNDLFAQTNCKKIIDSYIQYMTNISSSLQKYNVRLFISAVTPLNSRFFIHPNGHVHDEKNVVFFNHRMRKELCGSDDPYIFLDSFRFLFDTGFAFDNGREKDSGIPDGIHYSIKTSIRLYSTIIDWINSCK